MIKAHRYYPPDYAAACVKKTQALMHGGHSLEYAALYCGVPVGTLQEWLGRYAQKPRITKRRIKDWKTECRVMGLDPAWFKDC